jgi:hypothetical protein
MPVHDVHMDHASAARGRSLNLVCQMGEVRGEDGGCKVDQNRVRNGARVTGCGNFSTGGAGEGGGMIEARLESVLSV